MILRSIKMPQLSFSSFLVFANFWFLFFSPSSVVIQIQLYYFRVLNLTPQNKQPHQVVTLNARFCFPPLVLGRKTFAEYRTKILRLPSWRIHQYRYLFNRTQKEKYGALLCIISAHISSIGCISIYHTSE